MIKTVQTVTYLCDECGKDIDIKNGEEFHAPSSKITYEPSGLHYHVDCFEGITSSGKSALVDGEWKWLDDGRTARHI
jgi:hypothetical protein